MRKLGQTRLFYGFTPLEIRTLCQEMKAVQMVFEPGDRIFEQDTLPECAALILTGDVLCVRYDDEGNSCPLFLLEEDDLICSLSLFCTTPFPYTVDAIFHPVMEALGDGKLLAEDGVVCIRTKKEKKMRDEYGVLEKFREKTWGISTAHFYRKKKNDNNIENMEDQED